MEAIGLAVGVIGLYSACRDGFIFFENVKNAEHSAVKLTRGLQIQKSILGAWGFYWEIYRHDQALTSAGRTERLMTANRKIGEYLLQNPAKVVGVELALEGIAEMLSDYDTLRRYGIELKYPNGTTPPRRNDPPPFGQDQVKVIQGKSIWLRKRLTFLKRCRWVVRDSDKTMTIIRDLEDHNRALRVLCPDGAIGPLKIISISNHLSTQSNKMGLALDRTIAEELSSSSQATTKDMYGALADLTSIRGLAERLAAPLDDSRRDRLLNLRSSEFDLYQKRQDGETLSYMAIWRHRTQNGLTEEAVLVEFRTYLDEDGVPDPQVQDNVLKLGFLITAEKAPLHLRSRYCYGLFKDTPSKRIGFVYKLPGQLGISLSGSRLTSDTLAYRRPMTLTEALHSTKGVALGSRYALAKKLLESVLIMHATGWVHKNIRSTSVLFFPRDVRPIDRTKLDWHGASLMGWGFSRASNLMKRRAFSTGREVPRSFAPNEITLDVFQHPDKQVSPRIQYQSVYDIYSLGLVLLEIGLWRDLHFYIDVGKQRRNGPHVTHDYILREVVPLLEHTCGAIYADVVKSCLEVKALRIGGTLDEQQRDRCLRLVAKLARCYA